jgi:hypothetical protein
MESKKNEEAKIENILNRKGDLLPFGYYSIDDERVSWNCGYDQNNKITSIFSCSEDKGNRQIAYLKDIKEAIYVRDELIKAGWKKLIPPEITVKYADGSDKPLNHKQKRMLAKTMNKMAANSPVEDEEVNEEKSDKK